MAGSALKRLMAEYTRKNINYFLFIIHNVNNSFLKKFFKNYLLFIIFRVGLQSPRRNSCRYAITHLQTSIVSEIQVRVENTKKIL